jgi:hypothetical protein
MEPRDLAGQVPALTTRDDKLQSLPTATDERPHSKPSAPRHNRIPAVYVFNPFAEGHMARGKSFTPVKHQALLAGDLANLPQFLCRPHDVVLLAKRPSAAFLDTLTQAGFPPPEFVELTEGRINPAGSLCRRKIRRLRPWAWGPDSVELFEPLYARLAGEARIASRHFNDNIARLYSKAWSADFLSKALARCHGRNEASPPAAEAPLRPDAAAAEPWLCSEEEAGVAVDSLEDALEAIAAIRGRGHPRVVVKEALGLAGHNAIRLWEPDVLPAQRQWLAHALGHGRQLVVEPWLERVLDFSVQLEMGPRKLRLCGYTGLVNDRKGQFLANWAEADYRRRLPPKIVAFFRSAADISRRLQRLYRDIFSLLEAELQGARFVGPVSIDAFVYRSPQGGCRVKPVVEINPRYTMGRLTLELMKHASPGTCGLFRLVTQAQARAEGFADLSAYARSLANRLPPRLSQDPAPVPDSAFACSAGVLAGEWTGRPAPCSPARSAEHPPRIRQGALCLNDPGQAQVCLATFEVSPALNLPPSLSRDESLPAA